MTTSGQSAPLTAIIPQTAADAPTKTVLFLCTGNYYRSRFAEHYFNYLAETRGLPWRAISRGLRLTNKNVGPIADCTFEALAERGASLKEPASYPQQALDDDFAAADLVIAVKRTEHEPMIIANFPQWTAHIRYWEIHDVDCAPAEEAISELDKEVRALVEEFA